MNEKEEKEPEKVKITAEGRTFSIQELDSQEASATNDVVINVYKCLPQKET